MQRWLLQTARTGQVAEYALLEGTIAPVALATVGNWIVAHTPAPSYSAATASGWRAGPVERAFTLSKSPSNLVRIVPHSRSHSVV